VLNGTGVVLCGGYPSDGSQAIICTTDDLRNEIQKAIDSGKTRFQIRIHFSGKISDNDDQMDFWSFHYDIIKLRVKYTK
jgi:hypothetical protein